MKILAIGNSFSLDCTYYIRQITEGELIVGNLSIGGCSLKTHWTNFADGLPNYAYQNETAQVKIESVSIQDALSFDDWDVVTLQQASIDSGKTDTYYPYLGELIDGIRRYKPHAEIVFNQTWAYHDKYAAERFNIYGHSHKKMFDAITAASNEVCRRYGLRKIPTGALIHELYERFFKDSEVGEGIYCDGFHLNTEYGRYAAALVWAAFFLNSVYKPVRSNFIPENADAEIIRKINDTLSEVLCWQVF